MTRRTPVACLQVLDQSKSPKGGLKVKSASGNAAKAGISAGECACMLAPPPPPQLAPPRLRALLLLALATSACTPCLIVRICSLAALSI